MRPAAELSNLLGAGEAVFLHLRLEGVPRDAEDAGGFADAAGGALEGLVDELAVEGVETFLVGAVGRGLDPRGGSRRRRARRGGGVAGALDPREVGNPQNVAVRENEGAMDGRLELADVARPAMAEEEVDDRRLDLPERLAEVAADLRKKFIQMLGN